MGTAGVATTHGHWIGGKRTPTYNSWGSMMARCYRKKHPRFEDYGGRGIRVCARWRGSGGFENFLADMGERPDGLTLDRKDVNADYTPENCCWATKLEQRWNRRDMIHRSSPWQEETLAEDSTEPEKEDCPF